jgi:hypothetical protein
VQQQDEIAVGGTRDEGVESHAVGSDGGAPDCHVDSD